MHSMGRKNVHLWSSPTLNMERQHSGEDRMEKITPEALKKLILPGCILGLVVSIILAASKVNVVYIVACDSLLLGVMLYLAVMK